VELRHIRCAIAVADTLHFGRAAEGLFITQSALSQHIRNLERELRCQLFDRSSRRVTLTPAGEVFVAGARALLQGSDDLLDLTRAAQQGETGTVAVGVDGSGPEEFLMQVLCAWAAGARGVRLRLVSGAPSALIDAVHRRELDVAVVFGAATVPWAAVTSLCGVPLVALLPAEHRLASRPAVDPDDLRGERLIGLGRAQAPGLCDAVAALWESSGLPYQPALELGDASLVRMAVGAGLGVAVMAGVGPGALSGRVVAVPLAADTAVLPVVAVWHADCSMQARAFIRAAVKTSMVDRQPVSVEIGSEREAC
jgi:DNA-binding transcriptional LysR family regulator